MAEECPLCQVSEQSIKELKRNPSKKKSPCIVKALVLTLLIGLAGLIFWQFLPDQAKISEALPETGVRIGNLAPDFMAEDVEGNKISLSDFRGNKPVLLVFWATWCGYCDKELPDLKAFTQEYQDKIQIIAIASGEARQTIRDYIREKEINFLILLDEQRKIWEQYLVRGTPSHFLIDSQGKIVTLRPGLASKENLEVMPTMIPE